MSDRPYNHEADVRELLDANEQTLSLLDGHVAALRADALRLQAWANGLEAAVAAMRTTTAACHLSPMDDLTPTDLTALLAELDDLRRTMLTAPYLDREADHPI